MPLKDILERGYFPKELPAPFVTETFSSLLTSGTVTIEGDFAKNITNRTKIPKAKICKYSHARGGLLRRKLSICNPVLFYLLAREIQSNWRVLETATHISKLAATSPVQKSKGRAIDGKYSHNDRVSLAVKSRVGSRYVLFTDISRFYHSIYTHSIPWALHTKAKAKTNKKFTLLGNKLDFLIRQGQDGQTIGIPIGPDTSLVLAELIMNKCDESLLTKSSSVKGHRFIDDYELSFKTRTEAEEAFHQLETCLSDYELALNPKKTKVIELPSALESNWVRELKNFSFRSSVKSQANDLEDYFSYVFEISKANKDEPVLQFAIARLRSVTIHSNNWDLFQRLILLCIAPEPATLPYALEQIISRINLGMPPLSNEIQDVLNSLIETHAPLKHSSEVANALWGCLVLQLKITDKSVDLISQCDDSCIALLALDCRSKGLLTKTLDTTLWESFMNASGLYDEHWLLAYEANYKGWLPNPGGIDFVATDVNFSYLKANGVYFYDESLTSSRDDNQVPMPTIPSSFIPTSYQSF